MNINFTRLIVIFIILAFMLSIPFGGVAASGEQQTVELNPTEQSDTEVVEKNNHYLIPGALLIVLVILGAVIIRRPKK